ncbi:unnamed protein product [Phytophthora lilii]|uniref:Unnamed protein product n=1 Tax=Phytophthora lilii TaxID=2077276 RepID=A0A9W6XH47_9STRA|nr:unnamed protein product [Phytophthora lilii]
MKPLERLGSGGSKVSPEMEYIHVTKSFDRRPSSAVATKTSESLALSSRRALSEYDADFQHPEEMLSACVQPQESSSYSHQPIKTDIASSWPVSPSELYANVCWSNDNEVMNNILQQSLQKHRYREDVEWESMEPHTSLPIHNVAPSVGTGAPGAAYSSSPNVSGNFVGLDSSTNDQHTPRSDEFTGPQLRRQARASEQLHREQTDLAFHSRIMRMLSQSLV